MTFVIRRMEQKDVPDVYKHLVALFNESAQPEQNVNYAKGLKHLYDHVDHPWDNREIFIALQDKEIVGILKCYLNEYWYSHDKRAVHDILYVVPNARKTNVAVRLFKHFEEWAKSMGAIHCAASIFVPSEDAKVSFSKLMEHTGYKETGALYRKEMH